MGSRRGLTTGETLVAIIVLLLFAAIVIPIYLRTTNRDQAGADVAAMRRVYVGIAMYQEDNHATMPGNLAELEDRADREDLLSPFDPYVGTSKLYPVEPTLPSLAEKIPYRISHAYLGNYIRFGKAPYKRWQDVPPSTGILANVWQGSVRKTSGFSAVTDGPVLRIRTDGSLFTLQKRHNPAVLGDYQDLFTRVK